MSGELVFGNYKCVTQNNTYVNASIQYKQESKTTKSLSHYILAPFGNGPLNVS